MLLNTKVYSKLKNINKRIWYRFITFPTLMMLYLNKKLSNGNICSSLIKTNKWLSLLMMKWLCSKRTKLCVHLRGSSASSKFLYPHLKILMLLLLIYKRGKQFLTWIKISKRIYYLIILKVSYLFQIYLYFWRNAEYLKMNRVYLK